MKLKNCKFKNSIKIIGAEKTYLDATDKSKVVLTLVEGFIRVDTPRVSKLVPLSNVTDMEIDKNESTENGKGSAEGINGSSQA